MAFRAPGAFLNVFVGSAHSMSCVLGCQRELVGADLVLPATRLAFGQTHWLGLDLPGVAFALVEVTWPEAQPEFAGLGLAVCC